jgi:hypothetical protein
MVGGKCRPARQDAGRPPREVGEGRWRHTDDPRASPIAANAIFYGPMIAALAALESASVLELDIEPMQRSPWAR